MVKDNVLDWKCVCDYIRIHATYHNYSWLIEYSFWLVECICLSNCLRNHLLYQWALFRIVSVSVSPMRTRFDVSFGKKRKKIYIVQSNIACFPVCLKWSSVLWLELILITMIWISSNTLTEKTKMNCVEPQRFVLCCHCEWQMTVLWENHLS